MKAHRAFVALPLMIVRYVKGVDGQELDVPEYFIGAKTWKEHRWGNVRMGIVCGRVEVSKVDNAFRTMHLTRFGTSRRTSRLSVMFFVWTANSVSCGQGIFNLA